MVEERIEGRDLSDEEVLRLILSEEPAEVGVPTPTDRGEREGPILNVGSIGLAQEEIERGQQGLAVFPNVGPVRVQTLELVHRYANVLVVEDNNIVKEYGAASASIKAPTRSMEDLSDIAEVLDVTITAEYEVDVFRKLGNRVPRFIRILVDQDCDLAFETPRTSRRDYPEDLTANVPLELTNEAWITFWVTPTTSTTLQVYMSTTSAIGRE